MSDDQPTAPLIEVTMTASIEKGAKTRRVKVQRRKRFQPKPIAKQVMPGRARVLWKEDPEKAKHDYVVLSISMPVPALMELDALCEAVQMSRSRLIREAVKHFKAKVLP